MLPLSVKQMERLKEWVRPCDVIPSDQWVNGMPDIATEINGYEVQQQQVGDCSVLSSLAVAAHFELKSRYQRRLISNHIYPQDKFGNPIYNPCGKYIVKLFVNGCWRGVEVDDYLPVNKYEQFLCAYSSRGKLWVSLVEKAYLKLHGGYDFQGSNSSRDLFVLTGWLPDKVKLEKCEDKAALWSKIYRAYKNNDAMITIATGVIQDEDQVGLVGNHAYGVLEIVECEGNRLLLVKNPWGHFRWRGKFSYGDKAWTPSLKQALGYDNFSEDKGVFWITFEAVCAFFSHLDMNWNPDLLQYRKSFFDFWSSSEMQQGSGTLSLKDNPQYFINFSGTAASTMGEIICWVAISKLLVIHKDGSIEDEENSNDYIAMHVFTNPNKGMKLLSDKGCI